jgi:hypothetical protein
MRATDSLSIRGLVGLAKAEAKRWGSDHATVTHAASAFAQNWSGEFRDAFGNDGEPLLHRLLAAGQTIGNEAEVRNMITASPDAAALAMRLHAALRGDLAVADLLPEESTPSRQRSEDADDSGAADGDAPAARADPLAGLLRGREALDVAAYLLSDQPLIPALVGRRGCGKTSLAAEIARLLLDLEDPLPTLFFDPGTTVDGEPAMLLRDTLSALTRRTVVVVEDVDELARLGTTEPDVSILREIWQSERFPLARLVITVTALSDRLVILELQPWDENVVRGLVVPVATQLAEQYGVVIDHAAIEAALQPPTDTDTLDHPGLAIARLDIACARAMIAGGHPVTVADVVPA